MSASDVCSAMRVAASDPKLFERASALAIGYLASVADRRVYPNAEALAGLSAFRGPLQSDPVDALEVLDLLDRYGSPATVATAGGRYFGFVVGESLPAAGFVGGTSIATLAGLAAGRDAILRRSGWDVEGWRVSWTIFATLPQLSRPVSRPVSRPKASRSGTRRCSTRCSSPARTRSRRAPPSQSSRPRENAGAGARPGDARARSGSAAAPI